MRIFVMAQGKGSRWDRGRWYHDVLPCEYKQVLPITEDLNLITRTIRQFKFFDPKIICKGEFYRYLPEGTEIESFREPTGPIMKGIWNLKHKWDNWNRILILLGDVAFSNDAVTTILDHNSDLTLFGRLGENRVTGKEAREIFALTFAWNRYKQVAKNMERLWKSGANKLWDYYETYNPYFVEIDDYTDDVDDLLAYQKFWPKMKEEIIKDDEIL